MFRLYLIEGRNVAILKILFGIASWRFLHPWGKKVVGFFYFSNLNTNQKLVKNLHIKEKFSIFCFYRTKILLARGISKRRQAIPKKQQIYFGLAETSPPMTSMREMRGESWERVNRQLNSSLLTGWKQFPYRENIWLNWDYSF